MHFCYGVYQMPGRNEFFQNRDKTGSESLQSGSVINTKSPDNQKLPGLNRKTIVLLINP